jgi:putative endonuclease
MGTIAHRLFAHHRRAPTRAAIIKNLVIPTEGRNLLHAARKTLLRLHPGQQEHRVLYVGVTGFLMPRVIQHKTGEVEGFTRRYKVNRLVYYETFQYVNNAIVRETEIKKWRREKKVALIEPSNPTWEDLASDWGELVQTGQADSSLRSE